VRWLPVARAPPLVTCLLAPAPPPWAMTTPCPCLQRCPWTVRCRLAGHQPRIPLHLPAPLMMVRKKGNQLLMIKDAYASGSECAASRSCSDLGSSSSSRSSSLCCEGGLAHSSLWACVCQHTWQQPAEHHAVWQQQQHWGVQQLPPLSPSLGVARLVVVPLPCCLKQPLCAVLSRVGPLWCRLGFCGSLFVILHCA
jgi:hypothetical protein